jgi:hypothetical protein
MDSPDEALASLAFNSRSLSVALSRFLSGFDSGVHS